MRPQGVHRTHDNYDFDLYLIPILQNLESILQRDHTAQITSTVIKTILGTCKN